MIEDSKIDLRKMFKLKGDLRKSSVDAVSLEDFASGDISKIRIKIIGAEREKLLGHTLRKSYENLELPEFPGKYQIIGRVETRKQAFSALLDALLETAVKNPKTKNKFLRILHVFLSDTKRHSRGRAKADAKEKPTVNNSNISMNTKSLHNHGPQKSEESDDEIEQLSNTLYIEGIKGEKGKLKYTPESVRKSEEFNYDTNFVLETEELHTKKRKSLNKTDIGMEIEKDELPQKIFLKKFSSEKSKSPHENKTTLKQIIKEVSSLNFEKEENQENVKVAENARNTIDFLPQDLKLSTIENAGTQNPLGFWKSKMVEKIKGKIPKISLNGSKIPELNKKGSRSKSPLVNKSDKKTNNNSRDDADASKLQVDEINSIKCNIWIKMKSDEKFKIYFAKMVNSNLYLFKDISENYFEIVIACYKAKFMIDRNSEILYIQMNHKNDSDSVQITIEPDKQKLKKNTEEISLEIKKLFQKFNFLKFKKPEFLLETQEFKPVGKFMISVVGGVNFQINNPNSYCIIKINCSPFSFLTKKVLMRDPCWDLQKFIFPVLDHYCRIEFEIYTVYNDGFLFDHKSQEVLGRAEVLVADIMSKFSERNITLQLPIVLETKKKVPHEKSIFLSESLDSSKTVPFLQMEFQNLSSFTSWFSSPPHSFIEGKKIDRQKASKMELKINWYRLKRISSNIKLFKLSVNTIMNFKYPLFSKIFFYLLFLLVLLLDPGQLISSLLLILLLVTIYFNPNIKPAFDKKMIDNFFAEKHLNQDYIFSELETISMTETKKQADIKYMEFKIKNKQGIIKKYKAVKKAMLILQFLLMHISNFFEKIKNLIIWKDPQKTWFFLLCILVSYTLSSSLPLRYLLLAYLMKKYHRGKKYYRDTYKRNTKICQLTLDFIIEKHFDKTEFQKAYTNNYNWPQYSSFSSFQKKMVEQIQIILLLNVDETLLMKNKNKDELLYYLSTCSHRIRPSDDFEDLTFRKKLKIKKSLSEKISKRLKNFLNNIPSDYFRVLNPRTIFI